MNWRIDVKSESRYANLEDSGYKSLIAIESVDENLADKFFAAGLISPSALASADVEKIMQAAGVDEERAEDLKDLAALGAASSVQSAASEDAGEIPAEKPVPGEELPEDTGVETGEQPE